MCFTGAHVSEPKGPEVVAHTIALGDGRRQTGTRYMVYASTAQDAVRTINENYK